MVVVRVLYIKPQSENEWTIELPEDLEFVAAGEEAIRKVSQYCGLPQKEFTVLRIVNTNGWLFLKPHEKLRGSEHRVIVRRTGPWYEDDCFVSAMEFLSTRVPDDLSTIMAAASMLDTCRCGYCKTLLAFLALQNCADAFLMARKKFGVSTPGDVVAALRDMHSPWSDAVAAVFDVQRALSETELFELCAALESEEMRSEAPEWTVLPPYLLFFRFLRGFLLLSYEYPEKAFPLLQYCAEKGFIPARHLLLSAQRRMSILLPRAHVQSELLLCAKAGYVPSAASLLSNRVVRLDGVKPESVDVLIQLVDMSCPSTAQSLRLLADLNESNVKVTVESLFQLALSNNRIALHAMALYGSRLTSDQLSELIAVAEQQRATRDLARLLEAQ